MAFGSVDLKAAAMLDSLTNNHPLVDGNKRLGWLATMVFLDLNGYDPSLSDPTARLSNSSGTSRAVASSLAKSRGGSTGTPSAADARPSLSPAETASSLAVCP
ncbi:MAG TPA: Fic family protein [Acidimicrobiales bacterium]|nr:Fic family protein [Acidimicrobiales bacterium]